LLPSWYGLCVPAAILSSSKNSSAFVRNFLSSGMRAALAIAGVLFGASVRAGGPVALETERIATVDGKEVSRERFNKLLEAKASIRRLGNGDVPEPLLLTLKVQLADQLIDEALIERAAEEARISPSPEEFSAALDACKRGFGGTEAFNRFLSTYPLGLAELRHQLRLQWLMQALTAAEPLTEKHARQFYLDHQARFNIPAHLTVLEILVRTSPEDSPAELRTQRSRADQLRALVLEPRMLFHTVAATHSGGRTAKGGGDLGIVTAESVDSRLWEVLSSLEPGSISEVVQTEQGFHILKLLARKPAQVQTFEEVREALLAELNADVRRIRLSTLREQLRAAASLRNEVAERNAARIRALSLHDAAATPQVSADKVMASDMEGQPHLKRAYGLARFMSRVPPECHSARR
jgi:hypothetical protein